MGMGIRRLFVIDVCRNFIFLAICGLVLGGCRTESRPSADSEASTTEVAATLPLPDEPEAPKQEEPPSPEEKMMAPFVPDWVRDAVFYQIFPERFCNGDPTNDPIRESLEDYTTVPESWQITPWESDWYARADWEKEIGDRFYEGGVFHRRYGGDLQGVIDKLDYLQDLGINAIYFNPVFYGLSLHKYDGASMHHIDPYFGPDPEGDLKLIATETSDPQTWQWTAADKLFLDLVRQLHERKMHVIIDGVFNHTGRDFFAFADLREKQSDSDYKDWYIVQHFDNPDTPHNEFHYKSWWGFETLPEFADDASRKDLHPGPKKYVFDITRRWMDPDGDGDPADGIDGWRLDVANEVPSGFWLDWNKLVREINPEAYTVGEFWDDARQNLMDGRFSATMNYHGLAYLMKGFLIDGKLTPHDFGQLLKERLDQYPPSMRFAMLNLVDSHDTDRVASMTVNAGRRNYSQPDRYDYDVAEHVSPRHSSDYLVTAPKKDPDRLIQRLVALMQMTFVGPPMIYYGTEAGMWGADDPCNRQPMVWQEIQFDPKKSDPLGRERPVETVKFDDRLFQYYRSGIRLRRNNPILRQGDFEVLLADDPAKFFAFRRRLDGSEMVIAINRGDAPYVWKTTCRKGHSYGQEFCASGDFDRLQIEHAGTQVTVTVPALEGIVLQELPWEQ